eukprot:CAMPEP_0184698650 /NCGR_PEP_ID=MMETSP0313-20130426/5193_1 /TAXON_ID=2792 /ORGANISM="Porphyridium aerugineum, Strain SAG 1380-2" /LENGTH=467 /DNA_ID=CAMNT_0027157617 /DNA_START=78 /DNA_END=1481 /DNA_ORIENTATION=+
MTKKHQTQGSVQNTPKATFDIPESVDIHAHNEDEISPYSASPCSSPSMDNDNQPKLERQPSRKESWPVILLFAEELVNKPHTITLLVILFALMLYAAFQVSSPLKSATESNIKLGVFTACVPLLIYGCLQFRDGIFVRPHPVFWRFVMGTSLLYLMFLVFLLMQNADDARKIISYLDPVHSGRPLVDRTYAEHCEFTFKNVYESTDIFVIAHSAGWFAKGVMLRDRSILWIGSVLFELLEQTFKHMLLNFEECWWDSWLLDVFFCNWIGIELGLWFCKYLGAHEYHWTRTSSNRDQSLVQRIIILFSPKHFDSFHWHIFQSRFRFVAATYIVIFTMTADLNAFFLKTVLWVDVESKLNIFRLIVIGFAGYPSARELYQYVSDENCSTFGSQAWILAAILLTEICIIVKFGRSLFHNSWDNYFPPSIRIPWIIGVTAWLLFLIFYKFEKKDYLGKAAKKGKVSRIKDD